MSDNNFFSLIVCTLNRDTSVIIRLFDSLYIQKYSKFEVILMDQNLDDQLSKLVSFYLDKLNIVHVRSSTLGLSVNRNRAMNIAKGNIICFPDDDCFYDENTLKVVNSFFCKRPDFDFYCCSVQDSESENLFPMPQQECNINKSNFYNKCISIGIFYKPRERKFLFDERLGVGAEFGASEESDFISNLIYHKHKGYYNGLMHVYHPLPKTQVSTFRYYSYGLGVGALMKKELICRKKYSLIFFFLIEATIRLILSVCPIKKRHLYWCSFKGRIKGFFSY